MRTTPMEDKIMLAMTTNEYTDGTEDSWGQWTFAVIDESGINPKQARGVISSLIQKGLISEQDYGSKYEDKVLHFTDNGRRVVKALQEGVRK